MEKRGLKTPSEYDDYRHFTRLVSVRLSNYIFLKWKNKKTANLVKKLYKDGYTLDEVVALVILNS